MVLRSDNSRGLIAYLRFRWRLVKLHLALVDRPTWHDFFGASINRAIRLASTSPERTARLAKIWELGSRNEAFLLKLYALYEPMREELRGRGLAVEAVRELGDGVDAALAGAWSIATSVRLTEVTVNAPDAQVMSINDIRARESGLFRYAAPALAHARTRFLAQWQNLRKSTTTNPRPPLTDEDLDNRCQQSESGLNYVVRRLRFDSSGRVTLEVDRAGYGQIMRSCDYLIEEAFVAAGLCAQGSPLRLDGPWLLKTMPARETVMRHPVAELLTEPRHRAVGIGLAAIVTTHEPDMKPRLRYARRSFQVGTYPGLHHALPTGMFNGDAQDSTPHDQRVHPGRVILTEFLEELKGITSFGEMGSDLPWSELLRHHLTGLAHDPTTYPSELPPTGAPAFDQSQFRIWVTGLAFDLLSLRPEICCVMGLPSESIAEITLNEEGDGWFIFPGPNAKTIDDLPGSIEWVRSGYAAFALAHTAAQQGLDPSTACTPSDFGL